MSASTMTKQALSNEIIFKDNFCLNLNTGQRLTSNEGRWLTPKRSFYFPSGYWLDRESQPAGFLTIRNEGVSFYGARSSSTEVPHLLLPRLANANRPGAGRKGHTMSSFQSIDFEKIQTNLGQMESKNMQSLFWQLLILNPGLFKQARISPFILLFPNFQLGSFEPGLLECGSKNLM